MTTDFATYCLKVVSKFLKKDVLYQDFFNAVNSALADLENAINELKDDFFFNTMTLDAVVFMEKLLKITPFQSQTLENRQDAIRAKWRSSGHNSIILIRNVCESWKRGEIEADFINGKIQIKFVGEYGIPDDMTALINAINEIKPAHLAYFIIYKYLLIKDIHEVKTINQMQTLTIRQFARGEE